MIVCWSVSAVDAVRYQSASCGQLEHAPACRTHALGTDAPSHNLQYRVLTPSRSSWAMIILPSSLLLRDATNLASTPGNCARMDKQAEAAPPLDFATDWARLTVEGAGWVGSSKVWVRKRVPAATILSVGCVVNAGGCWAAAESCVSRRRRAIKRRRGRSLSRSGRRDLVNHLRIGRRRCCCRCRRHVRR